MHPWYHQVILSWELWFWNLLSELTDWLLDWSLIRGFLNQVAQRNHSNSYSSIDGTFNFHPWDFQHFSQDFQQRADFVSFVFLQTLAVALFSGSVDFLRQLETSLFQSMQSILPYLPVKHLLTVCYSNHSLTVQLKIDDWLTSGSFTGSFLLPVFCISTLVPIHWNLLQFLPELIIILTQRLSVNPCVT